MRIHMAMNPFRAQSESVRVRVSILVRRKRLVWSRHFDQAVARQTFDNDKVVEPEYNYPV
jgi:hypothetical protein